MNIVRNVSSEIICTDKENTEILRHGILAFTVKILNLI